jgi:hypothetical protein
LIIDLVFYAYDEIFVVSKREKGSGVPENSRGGTREFQYWKSGVPLLELISSTAGSREFHPLELNYAACYPLRHD